jgi:hypothetical protein
MAQPSELGKLITALRAARDPWSRLKLVAGGARLLSRLTQRERRELLRKVGLEGAEELADLAGGGDAAVTVAVEEALRGLESNPQQLQRFVRDLSQPQSRRATLAGLAAHVLEAVTAPPPPAPEATTPGAPYPAGVARPGVPEGLADTAVAVPAAAPATGGEPRRPPAVAGPGQEPRSGISPPAAAQSPAATGARETPEAVPPGPGETGSGAPAPRAAAASQAGTIPNPRQPLRDAAAGPAIQGSLPATGAGVAAAGTPAAGELGAGDPIGAVQAERSSRSPAARTAPPALATTAARPAGAPARPLAALRALREQLAAGKLPAREGFAETLEHDLPHDWARRRALSALFASGLPPRAEEALDLVGGLATDASRRWALADLAASRAWGDDDFARLLAAADSPALRRRLVNRRPAP